MLLLSNNTFSQLQITHSTGILYSNHNFAYSQPNEFPDIGNQADVVIRIQKLGNASNEPVPIAGASVFIEFSNIDYWDIASVTKVAFGWALVSSNVVGNTRVNEYSNVALIPNGYVDSFIIVGEVIDESFVDFPPDGFFLANRAWIDYNIAPGTWSIAPASLTGYEMEAVTGDDPLPVDLISFSALQHFDEILLDWQTTNEINNKGFEIQKSINGKDWKIIGYVDATSSFDNIINNYVFVDENPIKGMNFYRLNQIDIDGLNSFSSIVSILINQSEDINIYPNPARNEIKITGLENEKNNITIIDIKGRVVYSDFVYGNATVDVSSLHSGMYKIRIESGNNVISRSLVVQ